MNITPPAAHTAHDELLIARLFGGDVSEAERARALDQMGECGQCAALFADLGDIADATKAMPIPVRPRDFSLIQADAARLRRRRWTRSAFFGAGLRRSLGGALAALGLAGFMLMGGLTLLSQKASNSAPESVTTASRYAAPDLDQGAVAAGSIGVGAVGAGPTAAPAATTAEIVSVGAPSPAGTNVSDGSLAPVAVATPAPTAPPAPQAAQPSSSGANPEDLSLSGNGGARSVQAGAASQSGIDARLLWLGGFGVLFLLGLAVLLTPALLRRRRRGAPRS